MAAGLMGAMAGAAPPAGAGAVCTVAVDDVAVTEGHTGTVNAVFTLTRSTTGSTLDVTYATADDTAAAPGDYTAQSGTASFASADSTTTVAVPVVGDTAMEGNERFFLNLTDGGACTLADNQGAGTITNDDTVPNGYRLSALDGGVFAYGQSTYEGSANTIPNLAAPIIDIEETADRSGYWQVGLDGGVFAWNAPFFGSVAHLDLNAPVLAMAVRPQGDGYWQVGLDGGVFAHGNAPYFGNAVNQAGAVIVDIVSTSTGMGYWLLDAGGTVTAFGDAQNFGNYDARDIEAVGMDGTPNDMGYWIVSYPGKVEQFGNAADHGDIAEPESLNGSIAGMESLASGAGYWLVGLDGGVFAFDAPFYGSAGSLDLVAPVVAIAGLT